VNWRLGLVGVIVVAAVLYLGGYFNDNQESGGGAIVEVTVPKLDSSLKAGETAFIQNCAACHGENAAGKAGVAPPLVHKIYEPNHHGDMAFVLAAKQGVRQHHWRFGNMPPMPNVGSKEIATIIEYVRALQRANGIN
jgi:mono/diheme cytochrome c family protein